MSLESTHGSSSSKKIVLIVVGVVVGVILLLLVGAIIFGTMLMRPALGQAQEAARGLRSATHLRQIEVQLQTAAQDEAGPANSIEELIERGYITVDLLASPAGSVGDGRGDYWITFNRPERDEVDDPESFIVSYDRAMYSQGKSISACVLDGECSVYSLADFESLLANPVNEGRDFNRPARESRAP